jgi:uncharacterized protein (UPF0276 family)
MNTKQLIGIGLRHPHYLQVLEEKPAIGWLEVHTENFMLKGGPLLDLLFSIRQYYPLSFHGIGLSLGSANGVRVQHLKRIKTLIKQFDPFLLSDHLSWSYAGRNFLPDLLPIPYTKESLQVFAENIDQAQDFLQRTLLIENPSSYLEYTESTYSEIEFLNELTKRTGAKILLDVNNIYVSSCNHGWDPLAYLQGINHTAVQEIHLAGHSVKTVANDQLLRIDTHDDFVCAEVWQLYQAAIHYLGPVHTLLEWDTDLPSLTTLIQEAQKAIAYFPDLMEKHYGIA